MALPNIFSKSVSDEIITRINNLTPEGQPEWGKMDVTRMLAHCNVTYELVYEDIHKKPKAFLKFILKLMIKNKVVNEKPYGKNGATAPQFLITDAKVFETEKARLIDYIEKTQQLGEAHFDNKESHSFGVLNKD
ncbi:DUF1569 domain-containing protein [Pedobacter steynii]